MHRCMFFIVTSGNGGMQAVIYIYGGLRSSSVIMAKSSTSCKGGFGCTYDSGAKERHKWLCEAGGNNCFMP